MMDMGQITQGLRADILQQAAGQGINVAQMMEAGVSFADIMLLILQNTQSIANGQGITMPQNSQQTSQMPMTDLPQMSQQSSEGQTTQSGEMINQNEMSFMPDMKNLMPNMLNIQSNADMAEVLNKVGTAYNAETAETEIIADVSENVEASDVTVSQPVQNIPQQVQSNQNAQMNDESFVMQNNTVTDNTVKPEVDAMKVNTENPLKSDGLQQSINMPVVLEMEQTAFRTQVNTENKAVMPQVNEFVNNAEIPVIENIWQMTADTLLKPVHDNSDNKVHSSQFHNADTYISQSANIDANNMQNADISSLAQKLSEVVGLISPEFVNASENNSSMMNNSFVMDLISELSTDGEIKDSFDMSESILKIDPMQLAGLLDFISTGNGIPQAIDVSDSQMFKNLDSISDVKSTAEKIAFDPQEMLKTGEMEIVSYTPAKKNTDNSQQQSKQSDESTIDLARTMKSVREKVKTEVSENTDKFSEIATSMTTSNAEEIAKKVDISFERAYAELEMNKAKYGSADEQVYKGISENLERGRSEFTVRLRPEGLGEILVKLVSDEGGKAVLTLVASSEKTAELLNKDLASLQTSLNQHNVEIENNSVKTAETVMNAQTAFDQYNERQQDEARQQHHFRQVKKNISEKSDNNSTFESETVMDTASDSALNITI